MGASSGLAVEKSALQSGVADSLGWTSGDFGVGGGGDEDGRRLFEDTFAFWGLRRQLSESSTTASLDIYRDSFFANVEGVNCTADGNCPPPSQPPPPVVNELQVSTLKALKSKLNTFYMVQGTIIAIMASVILYWKHQKNRRCERRSDSKLMVPTNAPALCRLTPYCSPRSFCRLRRARADRASAPCSLQGFAKEEIEEWQRGLLGAETCEVLGIACELCLSKRPVSGHKCDA